MRLFKEGDVVKVWSLQSFFGGGFIDGTEGVVSQTQLGTSGSVLVAVARNKEGKDQIDPSYEVYPQQLKLVKANAGNKDITEFRKLIIKLKAKQNE